jgi:3'-phosphoadenosine 5'-phosphosulfate sulfotransferase (PAPS reductase)/FAD synthetase
MAHDIPSIPVHRGRVTEMVPDLRSYHWIVVNSSAGKDSQAMLDYMVELADAQGVSRDRIVVVHCDLGRVEWAGTPELAAEHATHYGLRFEVVKRDGTLFKGRVLGDLIEQVWERHESNQAKAVAEPEKYGNRSPWPTDSNRWCTSDQKTSQVHKLHTRLAEESRLAGVAGPARILDCLGMRAEESDKRAGFAQFEYLEKASSGNKHVDRWLPIQQWTEEQVWDRIWAAGTRWHWAYDKGMERLSCAFCVLASPKNWEVSIKHNRALADDYAEMERRTGHAMIETAPNKKNPQGRRISIQDIIDAYDRSQAVAA